MLFFVVVSVDVAAVVAVVLRLLLLLFCHRYEGCCFGCRCCCCHYLCSSGARRRGGENNLSRVSDMLAGLGLGLGLVYPMSRTHSKTNSGAEKRGLQSQSLQSRPMPSGHVAYISFHFSYFSANRRATPKKTLQYSFPPPLPSSFPPTRPDPAPDVEQSVIIVPGYGLAVARAQQAVAELTRKLTENGTKVITRQLRVSYEWYRTCLPETCFILFPVWVNFSACLFCFVASCRVLSRLVASCRVLSRLATSCHVLSRLVASCRVL